MSDKVLLEMAIVDALALRPTLADPEARLALLDKVEEWRERIAIVEAEKAKTEGRISPKEMDEILKLIDDLENGKESEF